MSNEYEQYLEAKVAELEAQVKLCMDLSYYKDARIRTLLAQISLKDVEHREALRSSCNCSS